MFGPKVGTQEGTSFYDKSLCVNYPFISKRSRGPKFGSYDSSLKTIHVNCSHDKKKRP